MTFAGIEKLSLIDYPGYLTTVVFTYGCNMLCPYCHNPELVVEPLNSNLIYDEKTIFSFLKRRVGKIDAVTITGGEPTLHTGILKFIEKVKSLNFRVKLDTNGSRINIVKQIIDSGLVDYWAMDVKYADELYKQGVAGGIKIADIQSSIDLIRTKANDYEFRTTVTRSIHNEKVMNEIGKMIKGSKRYFIQNFNAGKTIDKSLDNSNSFTKDELERFKSILENYVNSVGLRGI